jgi:hypothetical protein
MSDHRPRMKFKVIDGQIYSPADDLLGPEAVEGILDHYFVLQDKIQSLEKQLRVAVECLEWIAKTDTASHVYGPDIMWLTNWRNTRKQAASNTLAEIEAKEPPADPS